MRRRRLRPRLRLRRAAERLDRHRLALGLIVALVGVAAAIVSVESINGIPFTNPYRLDAVVPANAPIVRPGDEVRIAGQPVGEVRGVSLASAGRMISIDLDHGTIGAGARAAVRLRGLAGAVYIELHPGDTSKPRPSGSTIPRSRTSTGTQLTDVVAAFDRQARGGLRRTLDGYGAGMLGRGEQVNEAIGDVPPLLEEGTPLARALSPRSGDLAATVGDLGTVAAAAAGEAPGELGDAIVAARSSFEAVAAERASVGEAIRRSPGALAAADRAMPVANPLLADLTTTSRTLSPVLARLGRTLPRVNELLGRTDEVGALADIAAAADPTLRAAGPTLARLAPATETVPPLAGALEPLAAYVSRYPADVLAGPHGFTTWGRFVYGEGQAPGHRAVRFTPVFTPPCGRDPYPAPGKAGEDRC